MSELQFLFYLITCCSQLLVIPCSRDQRPEPSKDEDDTRGGAALETADFFQDLKSWHCLEESFAPHCSFSSPQAVGLGLRYVKLGGLSGAERMTKYNRLISIEEELAQQGILGRIF